MAFIRKTSISLNILLKVSWLVGSPKAFLNGILIRFIFFLIQTPPLYILIELLERFLTACIFFL